MARVGTLLPLQDKITVTSAADAKRAIIRDLEARAAMLKESVATKNHDVNERNAILVAVRVLEVALFDYSNNLVCF